MNGIAGIKELVPVARLGLAGVVMVCLTGCDGYGPTAPAGPEPAGVESVAGVSGIQAGALGARVQGPRPLRGSLDGAAVPGEPCSVNPPGLLITATAQGVVSHLGNTTLTQTACVSVSDFLPIGPSTAFLTAANGDRLDGTVIDVAFGPGGFDMQITIAGGTGRFARAGSEYDMHVVQSAPLQPFTGTLAGWVEY